VAWDVDAITAVNTTTTAAKAAAIEAGDTSGAMSSFRTLADGSSASTNVDAEKIRCYDESDAILDVRSFCDWQHGGDSVE
jgi:hypothetical protein